jgi:hypothetical protein
LIYRTFDVGKVSKAVQQYGEVEGFDPLSWLENTKNVALTNENDDIALFERQEDMGDVFVCGHYFFWSRGKEAIKASKEFLVEVFEGPYSVEVIMGLTPLDHKAALWMNTKLGFKSHGTVDTVIGPCRFVVMTKQQWKELSSNE